MRQTTRKIQNDNLGKCTETDFGESLHTAALVQMQVKDEDEDDDEQW